jgi:hypothetical protein
MTFQDFQILENMVAQLQAIADHSSDHHSNSVNVGQDLVNRFVKPLLPHGGP